MNWSWWSWWWWWWWWRFTLKLIQEKYDFFPLNRALSLSAMDEGSTDSKVDDLLKFVSSLVQRQREEVWKIIIIIIIIYRQDTAKQRQPVLKFTQWPKISILPLSEKHWIRSKYGWNLGHDELYHAKFGGDRTTRAGCRCENVVFVCLFCHAPRPAFEGVYFEHVLDRCLWVDFDAVFSVFFQTGLPFQNG